jgi:hypothetical protein
VGAFFMMHVLVLILASATTLTRYFVWFCGPLKEVWGVDLGIMRRIPQDRDRLKYLNLSTHETMNFRKCFIDMFWVI